MSLGKSEGGSEPGSVWYKQSPYLEGLYSRGLEQLQAGGYHPYAPQIAQGAQQAANWATGLQTAGGSAFGTLAGGGVRDPRLENSLRGIGGMRDPRTSMLTPLASGQAQNTALGGEIAAGLGDISRNFRENILPGINMNAALTNTAGGSRQGVAQGIAARGANRQAADFVNRMRSQNYATGLQTQLGALGQVGGLESARTQAQLGALGQLGGIQDMANQNMAAAMTTAPQLTNLGLAPTQSYWQSLYTPLQAYGNILGPPVNLSGGSSTSGWNVGLGDE